MNEGGLLKQTNVLKPYANNARTHSKEQVSKIANSIKRFGFTNPLLIDTNDNIIAGHGRLLAAQLLEMTEVPCVILDHLSADERRAYIIADNKLALEAGWDNELLKMELSALDDLGFELDVIGFSNEELDILLNDNTFREGQTGDDDMPSDVETRCKLGDIWLLGDHRLACGDSTDPLIVGKLFKDIVPVLMVTDPPYGVNYDPKWRNTLKGGHGHAEESYIEGDHLTDWSGAYSLFPGNVIYLWHPAVHSPTYGQNLIDCGFEIKCQIIWYKQHFTISRGNYHWQHEPCFYAVRKGCKNNWFGGHKQTSIWEIKNLNAFGGSKDVLDTKVGHAAQKPIECMLRPILNNTQDGDYVYDPFGGSGSTLIAAEKSKRRCLTVELTPHYCDVIIKRYEDFTGNMATLEASDG